MLVIQTDLNLEQCSCHVQRCLVNTSLASTMQAVQDTNQKHAQDKSDYYHYQIECRGILIVVLRQLWCF